MAIVSIKNARKVKVGGYEYKLVESFRNYDPRTKQFGPRDSSWGACRSWISCEKRCPKGPEMIQAVMTDSEGQRKWKGPGLFDRTDIKLVFHGDPLSR